MPNAPVGKISQEAIESLPDEPWASSFAEVLTETSDRLNEMAAQNGIILQQSANIEIKKVSITVGNPWLSPTMENAWSNSSLVYCKDYSGLVHIAGRVSGGVFGTSAFTLPAALRPHVQRIIACSANGATAFGSVTIGTNGSVTPTVGTANIDINTTFMPATNAPEPLSCFPVTVKTRFTTPPQAVLAILNKKDVNSNRQSVRAALTPSWTFIKTPEGPAIRIDNIDGLEYDCRQVVDILILGGK